MDGAVKQAGRRTRRVGGAGGRPVLDVVAAFRRVRLTNGRGVPVDMKGQWVTRARKRRFAEMMLSASRSPVGFVDVGAGGPLKMPWTLLPPDRVNKFDFEPEDRNVATGPLCVSDYNGRTRLFVAKDPRSSSLHAASETFVRRFDNDAAVSIGELDVDCVTLDTFFAGRLDLIDLVDINAEGHDFRVLQGARRLMLEGIVSLIKIEVLFTEVFRGQGWFSDIDQPLRSVGYDLVAMELDVERPAAVRSIHHDGELIWGKAFYVPAEETWNARLADWRDADPAAAEDRVQKAIVLYVLTEALGRAMDVLEAARRVDALRGVNADDVRRWIKWVFQYAELEARALDLLRPLNIRPLAGAAVRLVMDR